MFPFLAGSGARSKCRIRVYEPEDERDDVVVIASEMASNTGTSITNAAEVIAAEVAASKAAVLRGCRELAPSAASDDLPEERESDGPRWREPYRWQRSEKT